MTANQPTQTPSDIREAQVNPRELDRARNLICTKLIDGMQIGEYMFGEDCVIISKIYKGDDMSRISAIRIGVDFGTEQYDTRSKGRMRENFGREIPIHIFWGRTIGEMVDNIHAFINGAELPYPNQTDPAIDFESTKLSESGRIAVMDLIARGKSRDYALEYALEIEGLE